MIRRRPLVRNVHNTYHLFNCMACIVAWDVKKNVCSVQLTVQLIASDAVALNFGIALAAWCVLAVVGSCNSSITRKFPWALKPAFCWLASCRWLPDPLSASTILLPWEARTLDFLRGCSCFGGAACYPTSESLGV